MERLLCEYKILYIETKRVHVAIVINQLWNSIMYHKSHI